jgi:hypothetical protein
MMSQDKWVVFERRHHSLEELCSRTEFRPVLTGKSPLLIMEIMVIGMSAAPNASQLRHIAQ